MKKLIVLSIIAASILLSAAPRAGAAYDKIVATYFSSGGALKGCRVIRKAEDGSISLKYEAAASGDFAKLYTMDLKPIDTVYELDVLWQQPDAAPTPKPTSSPSPTPSPEPTPTDKPEIPDIYEKSPDATTAFAVVESAAIEAVSENETRYAVKVFYQGRERVLYMEEDMRLSGCSDAVSYMNDGKPSSLQTGDVVTFTTKLSGKIRDISLIYRPANEDIVTSDINLGANFEKLFSHNGRIGNQNASVYSYGKNNTARIQYVFGVITNKYPRSFTLANKDGKSEDMADISILDGTIVYTYDMNRKKAEIGSIGDITRSDVSDYDENGNILSWNKSDIHNYSLVRIIDGIATDVMVYINYND